MQSPTSRIRIRVVLTNIRGMNDGWTSLKFFSYIFASACILLLFISITSFRIYDVQMNKLFPIFIDSLQMCVCNTKTALHSQSDHCIRDKIEFTKTIARRPPTTFNLVFIHFTNAEKLSVEVNYFNFCWWWHRRRG